MLLVAGGGESTPLMSVVMVLLVAACARCSVAFWKSPSDRSATSMLVVTSSMLIIHSVLLGFGHVHGVSEATRTIGTGGTMPPTVLGVVIVAASVMELVVVVQLAFWLRGIHRQPANILV